MDLPRLWDRLISAMQERIGHQDVEIWLSRPARPLRLDGDVLWLQVDNAYYADWIRDNLLEALCTEASDALSVPVSVRLTWQGDQAEQTNGAAAPILPPAARGVGILPHQTFDNFVIGECNKFAHAAAQAVSERPARSYNPLFIYGSTGLGKTHLMHAIGNSILQHHKGSKVIYVTAETFMNEMIQCLRTRRMDDFRAKYRQRATVLLVDDVQFLSGKDRTQEEFFHTFNALQGSGHQLVLSSDQPPEEIDKLAPRLRTRFQGGLLADMQAPDKETLLAILFQKAGAQNLPVPSDVADVIAGSVAGNIRELEGVINKLAALHAFYNQPLTVPFMRKHLPAIFQPSQTALSVASIIEQVARFHSLRSSDILGNRRLHSLVVPRQIAMFLARKHTNLSFPELGREFDRDQSTIQYGVKKIEGAVNHNPDLAYKIRLIEQSLQSR